ncbi:hypothetical protein ACIBL5_23565 [Streptomyces sp. NPDC050516]|uniref:hypothetical protein n=1 Tax=Streptomyces sp. NPDC050516 TaxID=3365621 RepID=UPI003787BB1A
MPRIGDNEPDATHASYWAVPMSAPGALCDPIRLDEVIEAGTTALDSQAET